jgi:hypothetical protein
MGLSWTECSKSWNKVKRLAGNWVSWKFGNASQMPFVPNGMKGYTTTTTTTTTKWLEKEFNNYWCYLLTHYHHRLHKIKWWVNVGVYMAYFKTFFPQQAAVKKQTPLETSAHDHRQYPRLAMHLSSPHQIKGGKMPAMNQQGCHRNQIWHILQLCCGNFSEYIKRKLFVRW